MARVHVLLAAAGEVARLGLGKPAGGRDDRAQVPLERLDDERLGDVVRLEPQRLSLGKRRLGVRVGEQLVSRAHLVKRAP